MALVQLLDLEEDFDVVAQAADGRAAVDEALRHRPDVAVVDLEMPRLDGMGVAAALQRALPGCAVVILTGRGRPLHLQRALGAGARGFVVKGAPASSLADVIRRVHDGQRYVDPALAARGADDTAVTPDRTRAGRASPLGCRAGRRGHRRACPPRSGNGAQLPGRDPVEARCDRPASRGAARSRRRLDLDPGCSASVTPRDQPTLDDARLRD